MAYSTIILILAYSFVGVWSSAQAQDDESQSGKLILEVGKPIRIEWPGGYTGVLKQHRMVVRDLQYQVQIHENSCQQPIERTQCQVKMDYAVDWNVLFWEKHPDSSKIGSPVRMLDNGTDPASEEILDFELTVSSDRKSNYPLATKGLNNSELFCSNYDWLPRRSDSSNVEVLQSTSEIMAENFETGIPENKSLSQSNKLKYRLSDRLTLTSIDSVSEFLGFIFIGDVVDWVFKDKSNQSCQVTFKVGSLESAATRVRELEKKRPAPEALTQLVIYGENEAFFWDDPQIDLKYWTENYVENLK